MRILCLILTCPSLLATLVFGAQQPVRNLQVTLRGQTYDIDQDVTTVKDLQERVKDVSGVTSEQSVLFGGKRLEASDILSDVGVSDGAQLNMVPSSTKSKKNKSTSSASASTTASAASKDETADAMQDYLKQAGVDPGKLEEMMKGGAGGEGMPSMKESMDMMSDMMNSPMFQEYMSDPEKLEQSRQMILNNPMLKNMMAGMPGMSELLNDPDGFREAMQAAANMYKHMDPEQLMNMMGSAPGAAGGMPPGGLFDGTLDQSAAAAALDELDEDD